MFKRGKENKAKLEHKLYLARETPEPIFDLSECDIKHVPQGIYSLCRVFLKEVLKLDHNHLSSLSGGGQLKDLYGLNILEIQYNAFTSLPDDIQNLRNLKELYVNNNQLKKLPDNLCYLRHLLVLDVSNNCLKCLPDNLGNLSQLKKLRVNGNKHLTQLPKSISKAHKLIEITLDVQNFKYPAPDIAANGTEAIKKYICKDVGCEYVPPEAVQDASGQVSDDEEDKPDYAEMLEATIRQLENAKKQKVQDFLEIEKANEQLQQQELELANAQKVNRDKLLADITQQQVKFDMELNKIQQMKEVERFKLIEQIQETEQNADVVIKQLLTINRQPLNQLIEKEKLEEERLIAAANKYNETLRKSDILANMQVILKQETDKFQKHHETRIETSRSILEQELMSDQRLSEMLQMQDIHKVELISTLQNDDNLQKAAVGTLLERGDARSWGLIQQVRLVESQLAALTLIEIDKKKLQIDEHINDLAEKRINLSVLLIDLLEQQKQRRNELLSTLQILEANKDTAEDFWLRQYQILLDKLPDGLSDAQRNMNPLLVQSLLMNGVIHCLPFLAKLTQCQINIGDISNSELIDAGITNEHDRNNILKAFQFYKKSQPLKMLSEETSSAPPIQIEAASAPPAEQVVNYHNTGECVICLDSECHVIFVPCGHLCCCLNCSNNLEDCPLCRSDIQQKIRIVVA